MKTRILALILAVLFVFSCASAEQNVLYPSSTGLFAFEIPGDYIVVDGETIAELAQTADGIAMLNDLGITAEMLGSLDFSSIEYYYTPDFTGSLNVNAMYGDVSMEMIELYYTELDSVLMEQYGAFGVSKSDMESLGVQSFGENRFYGFQVYVFGTLLWQFITVDNNNIQYTFTFNNFDPEVVVNILSTFIVL